MIVAAAKRGYQVAQSAQIADVRQVDSDRTLMAGKQRSRIALGRAFHPAESCRSPEVTTTYAGNRVEQHPERAAFIMAGTGETVAHAEFERRANRCAMSTVGDGGYVDEDGFLYLTDRSTLMIICGGVNIYLCATDAGYRGGPGVRTVADRLLPRVPGPSQMPALRRLH